MNTLLIASTTPVHRAPTSPLQRVEHPPFLVRPVADAELAVVADLRRRAYGRHWPQAVAEQVGADAGGMSAHQQVLVAASYDGANLLGTIRLLDNGPAPLPLERSVTLPAWLQGQRLCEAGRLAVEIGAPSAVRWALFKAAYLYCVEREIQWLVIVARRAAARMYEGLRMRDVTPSGTEVPMLHAGGLPHRVLALNIEDAPLIWHDHPMRDFMSAAGMPEIRLH